MKTLFLLLSLCLLTGCVLPDLGLRSNISYQPYAGQQQDWPTSAGAFVDTNKAVVVYFGLPSEPYVCLGQIQASDTYGRGAALHDAAVVAKQKGADALLVAHTGERVTGSSSFSDAFGSASTFGSTTIASAYGSESTSVHYGTKLQAIVIKWKSVDSLSRVPQAAPVPVIPRYQSGTSGPAVERAKPAPTND